jgi:hypothetical protein
MDTYEAIFDIARAARRGDLAGVTLALDMLATQPAHRDRIINARSRADRDMGRTQSLPQAAESMFDVVRREHLNPRVRGYGVIPRKAKKARRAA